MESGTLSDLGGQAPLNHDTTILVDVVRQFGTMVIAMYATVYTSAGNLEVHPWRHRDRPRGALY